MQLAPRFVGRLGPADGVTVGNAAVGFLATVGATVDPGMAARLILLAAVADGLDGVLARQFGGTPAGPYLDSLADVASFAVAPAVLVFVIARGDWAIAVPATVRTVAAVGVPALFVAMAVARLGLYTAYDTADTQTIGAPSTLAAVIVASAVLVGLTPPVAVLALTAIFCYLMVSPIEYPDLLGRDAFIMGAIHTLAVLAPGFQGGMFPVALLTIALAYLALGPWLYWGETERERDRQNATDQA